MEQTTIQLRVPTPLRAYTARQANIGLAGATVGEAVIDLVAQYPEIRKHLLDDGGGLRSFVNLYLNGRDIRELGGVDTPVVTGDKLAIIPAIAGGAVEGRFDNGPHRHS